VAAKSPTSRKKAAGKKSAPKKASAAKAKPKAKPKPAAKASAPAKPKSASSKASRPPRQRATPPAPKTAGPPDPAAPEKSPRRKAAARPKRAAAAKKAAPPPEAPPEEVIAAESVPEERPPRPRGPREPAAHPDSGLSKTQVKKLHTRLLEERTAVLQEIRRSVQGAVEQVPAFTESIDQAQHETEQNFRLRLADKQRKLLNEIQAALLKLDEGEYGICEGTEEPIGFARLEVRPWARYSVEYKEMKDRRER